MNRSILIIICDFLLLSLLTFSTDLSKVAGGDDHQPATTDIAPGQTENNGKDLAAVMKLALTDEQKNRAQLQAQLTKAREVTGQQQALLNEREQQQQQLQQQYLAAQANLKNLDQQLQASATDATMTKEKLALTQADAQRQSTALQQQLDQIAKNNAAIQAEKDRLAAQLQFANEKAALMQQQVQAEREQNARLAEGFKALATNSSALTQEIRDNRALAPNTIFSIFITNEIQVGITGTRPGIFGTATDSSATKTVLVSDGTNIFAVCHVQDTPLVFRDPGTDWDTLTGTLGRDSAAVPIHSLSFHQQDPRVVFMPVTAAEARQLGSNIYRVAADPYKFQDAVIIGEQADYYGECSFQMDTTMPQYLKLDRNLLKGLFGKFNPSRGDFVFSRSGDLLGVMVNGTYCLVLRNFTPVATFPFGQDLRRQHTGSTLAGFYSQIFQSPMKLQ